MQNYFFNKDLISENVAPGMDRKIIANNDSIMAVEVRFETGGRGAIHQHVHEQVTYVVSGKFEFTTNGVTKIVEAGDSLFFETMNTHGALCLEKGILIDVFTPTRKDFLTQRDEALKKLQK